MGKSSCQELGGSWLFRSRFTLSCAFVLALVSPRIFNCRSQNVFAVGLRRDATILFRLYFHISWTTTKFLKKYIKGSFALQNILFCVCVIFVKLCRAVILRPVLDIGHILRAYADLPLACVWRSNFGYLVLIWTTLWQPWYISGHGILRLWNPVNTNKSALLNIGHRFASPKNMGNALPRQGPNGHSKFQSFGMYAYLGHLQYVGNSIDRSLDVRSSQQHIATLLAPTEMPPSCVSVITTMRLPSNTALPYRQGCWLKLGAIKSPFEGPQFKWPVLGRGQACQLQLGWSEIAF